MPRGYIQLGAHEPGSAGPRKDGGQATSGNLGARELEDSCPPLICMGLETIENCNKDNKEHVNSVLQCYIKLLGELKIECTCYPSICVQLKFHFPEMCSSFSQSLSIFFCVGPLKCYTSDSLSKDRKHTSCLSRSFYFPCPVLSLSTFSALVLHAASV